MPRIALLLLLSLCIPNARAQAPVDFDRVIEPALDSIYMLGVARRNANGPEVFQFIGTGWVIREGLLATNAHVAEALLEVSTEGRLVGKRSWSDRDELSLAARTIRIHPAYGPWNARLKRVVVRKDSDPAAARSMNFIPVADVATVGVEAGNTARPLPLADPAAVEPALSEPVVYLGFPHENISGFPTLHAVPGYVTAKTDFFFQRTLWADSYLIHYCGPVVGGASGSPMLNRAGQVIGLISAAENNLSVNGERTSFGFAYGQRVDLVKELLAEDYEQVQAQRDHSWSLRLANLLMPPDELLEQIASSQAARDGVPALVSTNTVTRRQVAVQQEQPARLQVTLEPGLRYGFLAAAHDGSDVDARVISRDGEQVLGLDVETDYYPTVWVGPLSERTQATFEVMASERLLQDTSCSLQVYKYEPQRIAVDDTQQNSALFFETRCEIAEAGAARLSWSFAAEAGAHVLFTAESADGYDIDLALALEGVIVDTDDLGDNTPIVQTAVGAAGTLELRLQLPAGIAPGSAIELKGLLLEGPRPNLVAGGDAPREPGADLDAERLFAQLDGILDPIWKQSGVTGVTQSQECFELTGTRSLELAVPAGALPIFVALAPGGQNIDLELLENDVLVGSDTEPDNAPVCAVTVADHERRMLLRVSELAPGDEPVRVAYRFATITR